MKASVAEVEVVAFETSEVSESDPELDRLAELYEKGGDRSESTIKPPPFDMRVARPLAECLHKGSRKERARYLLTHRMTTFHPPGKPPRGVWGIGYEAEVEGTPVDTLALEPGTVLRESARGELAISVGATASGTLSAVHAIGQAAAKAGFRADAQQTFQATIQFHLRALKIAAGAFGNGGAKWQLYRRDERIDTEQVLLQTVELAAGTETLVMSTRTWARSSGLFGIGAKLFRAPPLLWEIQLP